YNTKSYNTKSYNAKSTDAFYDEKRAMNDSLTQVLINYGPFVFLFAAGWFFGSRHERQHLAQLSVAEQALGDITVSSERLYRPKL
ncbi:hypothetical protein R0K04_26690, partial [Pseudoalteromonas sp. SIMBA_153]